MHPYLPPGFPLYCTGLRSNCRPAGCSSQDQSLLRPTSSHPATSATPPSFLTRVLLVEQSWTSLNRTVLWSLFLASAVCESFSVGGWEPLLLPDSVSTPLSSLWVIPLTPPCAHTNDFYLKFYSNSRHLKHWNFLIKSSDMFSNCDGFQRQF